MGMPAAFIGSFGTANSGWPMSWALLHRTNPQPVVAAATILIGIANETTDRVGAWRWQAPRRYAARS
ncbi:hypothetical protein GXW71_10455 [Roseomonas hellenica]|uniref:Uncharacterized protein n=1 Tax=Plastoroseomonas hellenica TaxID=2687306 RepID=A0ABS5EWU9_9PROT|nr:hypothetical protein [Plastoroseomonas hellenica]MBR0664771.1 hypothetical protein [Plastoroseomonas hellenica]